MIILVRIYTILTFLKERMPLYYKTTKIPEFKVGYNIQMIRKVIFPPLLTQFWCYQDPVTRCPGGLNGAGAGEGRIILWQIHITHYCHNGHFLHNEKNTNLKKWCLARTHGDNVREIYKSKIQSSVLLTTIGNASQWQWGFELFTWCDIENTFFILWPGI